MTDAEKIAELEESLAYMRDVAEGQQKDISFLKAQIELMKCCENCENEVYQRIVIRGTMPIICDICKDLSKWEFKK